MKITQMFPLTLAELQEGWSTEQSWPKRLGLLHFITKRKTVRGGEVHEMLKWVFACCGEIVSTLDAITDPKHEEKCGRYSCSYLHRPPKEGESGTDLTLFEGTVVEVLTTGLRMTLCHLLSDRQGIIAAFNTKDIWELQRAADAALAPADELLLFILRTRYWARPHEEPIKKSLKALLREYRLCWSAHHDWKDPFLPSEGQKPLPDLWYDIAIFSASGEVIKNDPLIPQAVTRFAQNNTRWANTGPAELCDFVNSNHPPEIYAGNLLVQYLAITGGLNPMASFSITK